MTDTTGKSRNRRDMKRHQILRVSCSTDCEVIYLTTQDCLTNGSLLLKELSLTCSSSCLVFLGGIPLLHADFWQVEQSLLTQGLCGDEFPRWLQQFQESVGSKWSKHVEASKSQQVRAFIVSRWACCCILCKASAISSESVVSWSLKG